MTQYFQEIQKTNVQETVYITMFTMKKVIGPNRKRKELPQKVSSSKNLGTITGLIENKKKKQRYQVRKTQDSYTTNWVPTFLTEDT